MLRILLILILSYFYLLSNAQMLPEYISYPYTFQDPTIKALNDSIELYKQYDIIKFKYYLDKGLQFSESRGDLNFEAIVQNDLAKYFMDINKTERAEKILQNIIDKSNSFQNDQLIDETYHNLGVLYLSNYDYYKSIKSQLERLKLPYAEKVGTYWILFKNFMSIDELQSAKYYGDLINKALRSPGNSHINLSSWYLDLGLFYFKNNELDSAYAQYSKAIKILEPKSYSIESAVGYLRMGEYFLKIRSDDALSYFERSFKTAKDAQSKYYQAISLLRQTAYHIHKNNTAQARNTFDEASKYLTNDFLLALPYEELTSVESYTKMDVRFEPIQKQITSIKTLRERVIDNPELRKELKTIESKSRISELNEEHKIVSEKIKSRRKLMIILGNILWILGGIIFIMHRYYKRLLITNNSIKITKKTIDEQLHLLKVQNEDLALVNERLSLEKQDLEQEISSLSENILKNQALVKHSKSATSKDLAVSNVHDQVKSTYSQDTKFLKDIADRFPNLNKSDLEMLSLVKLGYSNKEIARIMLRSIESIKVSKNRLKGKMNFDSYDDLLSFIKSM